MPGWDDPRYVEEKFKALQAKVDDLERKALPFAVQQKGPLPGAMRAIALNDPNLKASMWANYSNIGPGLGPYQAVTDANGIIRVELGNLAANGNSPAQEGIRVNDGTGTPFFDSLGLSNVFTQLGHTTNTTGYTNSTTSFTVITGSSFTFSLSRTLRILALASCFGSSASQTGVVVFFIDSASQSAISPSMSWGGGAGGSTATIYISLSLAAGSHTIDLRGAMTTTPGTLSLQTYDLIAWQLGS